MLGVVRAPSAVLDDPDVLAFQDGDAGIGGTEIDTDHFTHVKCSVQRTDGGPKHRRVPIGECQWMYGVGSAGTRVIANFALTESVMFSRHVSSFGARQFRRGRLRDDDHRRSQQAAVQRPGLDQACMTVPGAWVSLSCSAIAWCRLGSNGLPDGSSCLIPLRSSVCRKLRSIPSRPSRTLATISGCSADGRRQAVDAALQVLGCLDDVGGEFLHRVLARVVDLLSGAGADVGVLRLGPHPAFLHLRQFGLQLGDAGGRCLHQRFRREGRVLRRILRCGIGRVWVLILHGFLFDIRLRVPFVGSRIEMRFDGHGSYRVIGGHQLGNGAAKNNRFRVR